MKGAIQSAVTTFCFPPSRRLSRRALARSASRVLGQGAGRFESRDISDLSDDPGSDDDSATVRGMYGVATVLDEYFAENGVRYH